jgi:NADH:ubiquinone oxidoreductase subunit 2 (subunit N)
LPVSLTNHGMDIRPYLLGLALVYTLTGLTSFESLYSLLSVLSINNSSIVGLSSLVTEIDPLSLESLSNTPLSLSVNALINEGSFKESVSLLSTNPVGRENIIQGISLGLILIVVGFLFKIAAAPFHNWSLGLLT